MKRSTEDRQRELIATIQVLTEDRGFPPTMRECAAAMKLSLARIAQLVEACAHEGQLSRHPRIARCLRVLRPKLVGGSP
jgi:SOS-response transcriptional repressor LexA